MLMKIFFTTIITLCFYLTSTAQINFKNPPWETGCDSLMTQMEMNICSGEKFQIADSILNYYYKKLIKYIDRQYKNELKEFKDTTDNDQKEYLIQLKAQKKAIIKSENDFLNFRNSTISIIDFQYKGGSMRPMMVNMYALDLTVNQIKILIKLKDEIIDK